MIAPRRILILGIGSAQADAIAYCKARGHEVSAVGSHNTGPGRALVDHFEAIDITDKIAVLQYARKMKAEIVYSVGSDVAMPTVGFVAAAMGTPLFVPEATAVLLQHKGTLRAFLRDRGLGHVPFMVAASHEELADWSHFPAVIKPVDSQGQRGVFEVQNRVELCELFGKALAFSRSGKVICEQYLAGREISVNAFVQHGTVVHVFATERYTVEGLPGGIVRGHGIPADMSADTSTAAHALVQAVIAALDIKNGPVYFQMMHMGNRIYVIEVTPRLDGCHMWRLIRYKHGVDLLDLSFRFLEGGMADGALPSASSGQVDTRAMRLDFFLQKPHTPFAPPKPDDNGVLFREWYYKEGDIVRPVNGYAEKTGYQISYTSQRQ